MSRGSGRPRMPDALRRSIDVRMSVRPQECEDLKRIAEAWGVALAECAWLIVASRIAEWRGHGMRMGEQLRSELIGACEVMGFPVAVLRRAAAQLEAERLARRATMPSSEAGASASGEGAVA